MSGSATTPEAGEILVALEGTSGGAAAPRLASALRARFPERRTTVLLTRYGAGGVALALPGEEEQAHGAASLAPSLAGGGIPGEESPLGALLREGVRRGAAAVALVGAGEHDPEIDWQGRLLAPVLEQGFDLVCPAYLRQKTDAMLATGIVYPLTRALYGWRLRQPLGGEVALSNGLARRLLDDADWRRDPIHVGSDPWLIAKALTEGHRACQAWLGRWPSPEGEPEEASQALARVLGLVFREMERRADRWQRVEGSRPVPGFGEGSLLDGSPSRLPVGRLVEGFQIGQRDLGPVWGLVLPPATLVGLRRAAAAPPQEFRLDDALWARLVYDFAVAYYARTMERRQLLLAMTPLYLGWVASFLNETRDLDGDATEARVEALCGAFEREKRYLIARWRWPDSFNP